MEGRQQLKILVAPDASSPTDIREGALVDYCWRQVRRVRQVITDDCRPRYSVSAPRESTDMQSHWLTSQCRSDVS